MRFCFSLVASGGAGSLLAQAAAAAEARLPTVCGMRIALADRGFGDVFIVDAADFDHLWVVEKWSFEGNPGRVVISPTGVLIPAGHQGLIQRGPVHKETRT